jgi:hypothetical protein
MTKTEPWFTRLSTPTVSRIERLMEDFGYRSRDAFLEDAFSVLEAVNNNSPLPKCIEDLRKHIPNSSNRGKDDINETG